MFLFSLLLIASPLLADPPAESGVLVRSEGNFFMYAIDYDSGLAVVYGLDLAGSTYELLQDPCNPSLDGDLQGIMGISNPSQAHDTSTPYSPITITEVNDLHTFVFSAAFLEEFVNDYQVICQEENGSFIPPQPDWESLIDCNCWLASGTTQLISTGNSVTAKGNSKFNKGLSNWSAHGLLESPEGEQIIFTHTRNMVYRWFIDFTEGTYTFEFKLITEKNDIKLQ